MLFWFLRSGFGRFTSNTHLVCFKAYLSGIESQPLIVIMMMPSYQMLAFDHAYISQWFSQGSGESAHMRRRARTFCNSPSKNMDADEHSNINQLKPSVLFVGHMQTVDIQTRRRTIRRLIRVSTVCLQNVLSTFK